MIVDQQEFIESVKGNYKNQLSIVRELIGSREEPLLTMQPAPTRWSFIQCIDHLNKMNGLYFKNMEKAIPRLPELKDPQNTEFKPSWMGKMMINNFETKENGLPKFKMPTFSKLNADMTPQLNTKEVGDKFHFLMSKGISLLDEAKTKKIRKRKVNSAIGSIIRVSVGDAFKMIDVHNHRHIEQGKRALKGQ